MAQRSIRGRDSSSTEACGYTTFLLSNALFVLYMLWAFLPDDVIQHIDENYTTYYPPRELAGYIPAYLSLLFVFAPFLYMGLNMRTCPAVDSVDGIWDTRSNACREEGEDCDGCGSGVPIGSLPAICDEDVRSVNLRIRERLMKQNR